MTQKLVVRSGVPYLVGGDGAETQLTMVQGITIGIDTVSIVLYLQETGIEVEVPESMAVLVLENQRLRDNNARLIHESYEHTQRIADMTTQLADAAENARKASRRFSELRALHADAVAEVTTTRQSRGSVPFADDDKVVVTLAGEGVWDGM